MKLPIGIQTFSEIQENGYLYVDKTQHIHRVISDLKYCFLSRPRRFGKSLLVSTLQALYEGRKELFEGLWIANQWDWEKQYPVIHIQFSKADYQGKGLEAAIIEELKFNGTRLGISLEQTTAKSVFFELITKASKINKVVVLIDEYDKPIIDYLEHIPQAKENRQILKNFYSILKDSDPYLEQVFITGVSRFAKTSIFSDLNNITNLTMDRYAVELLGITQEELTNYFSGKIVDLAKEKGITGEDLIAQIRYWYNGYSWDGKHKVYNPFSLLSFFMAREFRNFWFKTGTPTFLIKIMRKQKFYQIGRIEVSDFALDSYELETLDVTTILFQTGYLTILKKQPLGVYELGYPNNEVKMALEERLLNDYAHDISGKGRIRALHISRAFRKGDIGAVIEIINSAFSSIPSNLWQQENEAFYHALTHLTFSLLGVFIQSEINSSKGRLDAKVETDDTIYILEFKLDKSAEEALRQIEEKQYFKPYLDDSRKRVGIGINFSTAERAVEEFLVRDF